MKNAELPDWAVSFRADAIFIFLITGNCDSSELKCGLKISKDVKVTLLHGIVKSEILDLFSPLKTTVQLENGLKEICKSFETPVKTGVDEKFSLVEETLGSLILDLPPDTHNTIKFMIDQINLLKKTKKQHRYSWEMVLFCSLLHSISPHCYSFLRNSGNLILPSSSTIKRVCSKFSGDPQIEQHDPQFLNYVKLKHRFLEDNEKIVALLIDEIHLKPFMDYKGGTIVGKSYNSTECATTAHVFMLAGLRSNYKDVAHILPVYKMTAEVLHRFLKKIIIELENIGFKILTVVTDNNSINRKAMSLFVHPAKVNEVYKHPADENRPLFFIIDTVHIMKNIRNNWINQKNGQVMKYPDFNDFTIQREAHFDALKTLHQIEQNDLLKYGYSISLKALFPTSVERQNVKLVLQIFNHSTVTALRQFGPRRNLSSHEETANYLEIFCKWWDIVNTKTLLKGKRSRNAFQEPITTNSSDIFNFLNKFVEWLDYWRTTEGEGKLTKETHNAIHQSISGLLQLSKYCLDHMGFNFFLCGKIQTDKLEERFGKYRQYSGSQYQITLRQVLENEKKLRMQSMAPLIIKTKNTRLEISAEDILKSKSNGYSEVSDCDINSTALFIAAFVNDDDLDLISDSTWPILVFIAGYASYIAKKKINCGYCEEFIIDNNRLPSEKIDCSMIHDRDRGGLSYPTEDAVKICAYTLRTTEKLFANEHLFLTEKNQKAVARMVTFENISESHIFMGHNCSKHQTINLKNILISCATNILLNNYCKNKNNVRTKTQITSLKRGKH